MIIQPLPATLPAAAALHYNYKRTLLEIVQYAMLNISLYYVTITISATTNHALWHAHNVDLSPDGDVATLLSPGDTGVANLERHGAQG